MNVDDDSKFIFLNNLIDERFEDLVLKNIDKDRNHKPIKPNNLELLGHCFVDASNEIGYGYPYGAILAKVGEAECRIGEQEKYFVMKSNEVFIGPLKSFLEGQMKSIQKEKKTLELKRLDLDACKTKLKKLHDHSPSHDVRINWLSFAYFICNIDLISKV